MTLVVVAFDDFTLRVETDNPAAPVALLAVGTRTQREMDRHRPKMLDAIADLIVFGECRLMLDPLSED